MSSYRFTSESVNEGHPDKLCDQVSDAILDAILAQDPRARVACETLAKTGMVVVAGEITTTARLDFPQIVRETVKEIGYVDSSMGFDGNTCAVLTAIERQSPDIAQGVNEGDGLHKEQGAGDQGLMFGYASDETPELMPAPIQYAHTLARQLAAVRKKKLVDFLRPDGKTQITLEYENHVPVRIDAIVVSIAARREAVKYKQLREAVIRARHRQGDPGRSPSTRTRRCTSTRPDASSSGAPWATAGSPDARSSSTRTAAWANHGGGAFSGKDPSKVDRSACYYARYVAKNVVASGVAKRCEVQVAYAIGVARPVGVNVNTFGTGKVSDEALEKYILASFDMRPKALIDELGLLAPVFKPTAAYGHFGRREFSWEKTDRAAQIADDLLPKEHKGARTNGAVSNGHKKPAPGKSAKRGAMAEALRRLATASAPSR